MDNIGLEQWILIFSEKWTEFGVDNKFGTFFEKKTIKIIVINLTGKGLKNNVKI